MCKTNCRHEMADKDITLDLLVQLCHLMGYEIVRHSYEVPAFIGSGAEGFVEQVEYRVEKRRQIEEA